MNEDASSDGADTLATYRKSALNSPNVCSTCGNRFKFYLSIENFLKHQIVRDDEIMCKQNAADLFFRLHILANDSENA